MKNIGNLTRLDIIGSFNVNDLAQTVTRIYSQNNTDAIFRFLLQFARLTRCHRKSI
ncbi:hypothetical protein [Pantoea ananatis]|uniref:hypothetical protein n=1 Tax=Pantoea ananas TaxID=553 RepID=UPI0024AE2793|nr:hypothetical protein [Pantoea ananatis]